MSGGKETPRQKMIGMMYLVLTALLALNVSKAILDAFVAIEKNTQKAALTNYERGKNSKADVTQELSGDASNVEKLKKVKYCLEIIEKIDKETEARIKEIDDIKMDILKKSGEDITKVKKDDKETILWSKRDKCIPAAMNLMAVNAKDQYDVPMHEIIGEDLKNPSGSGKALWKNYNDYRNKITGLMGTWAFGGQNFSFKPGNINKFKNNEDLTKQIEAMYGKNGNNVNKEDQEAITQVYAELSKNEIDNDGEVPGLHWIGKTFDHSPLVAAIASLTAMQQEILGARASAIARIKSKVTTGEYSFNKIVGLAYGPPSVNANEEFEVSVMMAAYDSDNNPEVPGSYKVENGVALVKGKGSGSEVNMNGTVSIRKKDGTIKKEAWKYTVRVMKPEGNVSLPEMNMLYRGYPNQMIGVASGWESTSIVGGTNITSLSKSGTGYVCKPGAGRTASVSLMGKSGDKSGKLGTFEYRVSNLPPAQVSFGGFVNGESAPRANLIAATKLFVGYPPEIPLKVDFALASWTLTVGGAPRPISGTGSTLSPAAIALLKQAPKGSSIAFTASYSGGGMVRKGGCVIGVN